MSDVIKGIQTKDGLKKYDYNSLANLPETPEGGAGISITSAEINENGELVLVFSDGQNENLGKVVGEKGDAYVLTEEDVIKIANKAIEIFPVYEGEVEDIE